MEIFGVPVSEDTVKNTAVSGAVLLGLWQFVISKLPWQSWLEKLLARFVPKPVPVDLDEDFIVDDPHTPADAARLAVYEVATALRMLHEHASDAESHKLISAVEADFWQKRKPVEPAK